MKTAVDTSVLLDVLTADPAHGAGSRVALHAAFTAGSLVVCDVVWAELRAHFAQDEDLHEVQRTLGIRFDPIAPEAASLAGELWRVYRRRSGTHQNRVVTDFLIGAHARLQADVLLTRARGFYRDYFKGLRLIDPARRR